MISKFIEELKKISYDGSDESVELILDLLKKREPFAYARFNDGEMIGIDKIGAVAARGDQPVNKSLHQKLIEGIQHVQKNYYVGLPCPDCFPKYAKLARELVKQPKEFQLNAVVMTNRNWAKFINEFPETVKGRKIVWISGADQNLDVLKNVMGLNIVKHIKHPAKDTWTFYNHIRHEYSEYTHENPDFDIVLVSSGPTARVFCKEYFEVDSSRTYIDIGSTFDPFTRNVWHNCHKGWIETGFNLTRKCKICN